MGFWFTVDELIERGTLPAKFKGLINEECSEPSCKSEIMMNSIMTKRMCINPCCPLHMKFKCTVVLKHFGVTEVAEETCYKHIIANKFENHLDIIPIYFKNKPKVLLWEVAYLSFIPGISTEWQAQLKGKTINSDFSNLPDKFRKWIPTILDNAKYFEFEDTGFKTSTAIAVHGYLGKYGDRKDFVKACNAMEGNIVFTELKSSMSSKVKFLVTNQKEDTSCGKVRYALEHGVQIITPEQYSIYLLAVSEEYKK